MKPYRAMLLLGLCGRALGETALLDEQAGVPQTPFDNNRYSLGFDVYVAGGKLPAAWQVARKAVSLRPDDPLWLKRYAQVWEWVGQPAEALTAWLRLARLGGGEDSWNAVGRLAPMLLDDEALLAYRQRLAVRRPGDRETLAKLVEVYERLGRPDDGLRFLKTLENAGGAVLEAEAGLAERSGRDEAAISALTRLLAKGPPEESRLLRRASLQYRRGQLAEARAGLAAAEKRMPVTATGYWQTYADLSRLLNDGDTARRAYQVLVDQGKDGEAELWNYAALLQDSDPLAAAGLQERLFRRFGRDNGAINALSLWLSERAWAAADGFLAGLSANEEARLADNSAFLEQRARLHWLRGRLAEARRDYAHGLQLSPEAIRLTQGLAGVLLEQDDAAALQQLLQSREALARRTEALWPSWIAGWQRLRQPSRALPYQQAWQQRHPDDAVAALALADSLEAADRPEEAARLRRRVQALAGGLLDAESPERRRQLQDALLALNLPRTRPEAARRLLDARLGAGAPDAFSRELALSWLLNHDAADQARALAARTPSPLPAWAGLGFALAAEDRDAMNALLNLRLDELPVYDRLEAAERLGRIPLATDLAFRTLEEERPDDDELHHRFARLGASHGHRLDLQLRQGRQSGLALTGTGLDWEAPLGDRHRLSAGLTQETWSRRDAAAWGSDPSDWRTAGLVLERRSARSRWQLGLSRLESATAVTGVSLSQAWTLDRTLGLDWSLAQHTPTGDSAALHLAASEDRRSAGLRWTPDGRLAVIAQLTGQDYRALTGEALGHGRTLSLDTGFRLFAAQPDQVLKLQLGAGQFRADTAEPLSAATAALVPSGIPADSRFFLPQDYRQLALAWAFGQLPEDRFARGWRLFGEVGGNRSDSGGNGYRLELGLHGPLLGGDSLQLRLNAERSARSQGNDARELRLDYRIFY